MYCYLYCRLDRNIYLQTSIFHNFLIYYHYNPLIIFHLRQCYNTYTLSHYRQVVPHSYFLIFFVDLQIYIPYHKDLEHSYYLRQTTNLKYLTLKYTKQIQVYLSQNQCQHIAVSYNSLTYNNHCPFSIQSNVSYGSIY